MLNVYGLHEAKTFWNNWYLILRHLKYNWRVVTSVMTESMLNLLLFFLFILVEIKEEFNIFSLIPFQKFNLKMLFKINCIRWQKLALTTDPEWKITCC